MSIQQRPRLLFLRFSRPNLPEFIALHFTEQVRCLEQFFDVTTINTPIDYDVICDHIQPDLVVFESGVYVGERTITNICSHPHIPRLGFIHCDAYCPTRKNAIADMARWGVEHFFTTSVALPLYTTELVDRIFVWPNFVNPDVYHDYGLMKSIPVLFTGSQAPHYPWRNRIHRAISRHVTHLQTPHFGWFESSSVTSRRMPHGAEYARLINASIVAPTCGTIAKDVVRKHFEIPACNTCLVTEKSSALLSAGFVDLENCVFADEHDILDKLTWLFHNPDDLHRITDAGHNLVMARHTAGHRSQVRDWYTLMAGLRNGHRIIQPNPFLPLTVVDESYSFSQAVGSCEATDRGLILEGDASLANRDYASAENAYLRAKNYHDTSEATLRLSICLLHQGNAEKALTLLQNEVKRAFNVDSAMEPDPVEWAYLVVALLCVGENNEALECAGRFLNIRHPKLDRIRGLVFRLAGQEFSQSLPEGAITSNRPSIHSFDDRSEDTCLTRIIDMLEACTDLDVAKLDGRPSELLAMHIALASASTIRLFGRFEYQPSSYGRTVTRSQRFVSAISRALDINRRAFILLRCEFRRYYRSSIKYLARSLSKRVEDALQSLDLVVLEELASRECVSTALTIGASPSSCLTQALVRGMRKNPHLTRALFTYEPSSTREICWTDLKPPAMFRFMPFDYVDSVALASGPEQETATYDLLAVDFAIAPEIHLSLESFKARLVILAGINTLTGHQACSRFMSSSEHFLLHYEPLYAAGYAVFQHSLNSLFETESSTPHVGLPAPTPYQAVYSCTSGA